MKFKLYRAQHLIVLFLITIVAPHELWANEKSSIPIAEAIGERQYKLISIRCVYEHRNRCPITSISRERYNAKAATALSDAKNRAKSLLAQLRAGRYELVSAIQAGRNIAELSQYNEMKGSCSQYPEPYLGLQRLDTSRARYKFPGVRLKLEYERFRDHNRIVRRADSGTFRLYDMGPVGVQENNKSRMYAVQFGIKERLNDTLDGHQSTASFGVISAFLMPSCVHLYTFRYSLSSLTMIREPVEDRNPYTRRDRPGPHMKGPSFAQLVRTDTGFYFVVFSVLGIELDSNLQVLRISAREIKIYEAGYFRSRSPYSMLFRSTE